MKKKSTGITSRLTRLMHNFSTLDIHDINMDMKPEMFGLCVVNMYVGDFCTSCNHLRRVELDEIANLYYSDFSLDVFFSPFQFQSNKLHLSAKIELN